MITEQELIIRSEALSLSLQSSEDCLLDLRDRMKCLKKEIANTIGAIIEIDRMIESLGA